MGKRWTDKEDDVLVTMRDAGTSYREIASIMGRTPQSCQQRVFKLWVKPSRTQSTVRGKTNRKWCRKWPL